MSMPKLMALAWERGPSGQRNALNQLRLRILNTLWQEVAIVRQRHYVSPKGGQSVSRWSRER